MPVTILHLSDLHFGSRNFDKVWPGVAKNVRAAHPDLIVVTGDIVDSPDKNTYTQARNMLDSFGVELLVCPGNHDRYYKGLRLGFFSWRARNTAAFFDQAFRDVMIDGGQSHFSKACGKKDWAVAFLGLDSSIDADNLARGYISPERGDAAITAAKALAQQECDLAILMVHHHLLPVRALEEAARGIRHVLNATVLVNGGTLLEGLSEAHIDIALHGHEHAPNWGRYGSLEPGHGEVHVLAAGSATGNHSTLGCNLVHGSFNTITLEDDRSVKLKVHAQQGMTFKVVSERTLFTPSQLRRNRFLRHSSLTTAADSEVSVSVDFTRDRDILIHEDRTNWTLDATEEGLEWSRVVRNSTGIPSFDRLVVRQGDRVYEPELEFKRTGHDHGWLLKWTLIRDAEAGPAPVYDMDLRYRWSMGGVLTSSEARAAARNGDAGIFRREGLEYAAVKPLSFVSSAELFVSLPRDTQPTDLHIRVTRVVDLQGRERLKSEEKECDRTLKVLSDGRFYMRVPFPRPDFRYAMVWTPPEAPAVSSFARRLLNALSTGAPQLAQEIRSELGRLLDMPVTDLRCAIYALALGDDAPNLAEARLVGSTDERFPPKISTVGNAYSSVAGAWWGNPTISLKTDQDDDDFVGDEQVVLAFPLRAGINWTNEQAHAVLRVGSPSSTLLERLLDQGASVPSAYWHELVMNVVVRLLARLATM